LQEQYEELFQSDIEAFCSTSPIVNPSSYSSSSCASCSESSNASNKRNSSEMYSERATSDNPSGFDAHCEGFCFGVSTPSFAKGFDVVLPIFRVVLQQGQEC